MKLTDFNKVYAYILIYIITCIYNKNRYKQNFSADNWTFDSRVTLKNSICNVL